MKTIELLAPAGDFETMKMAIDAGCDAVYFAGKNFGARSYAPNFSDDEIIEAINYCHLYNVYVFITINTVIFENEIDEVIDFIDFLYLNNVDGVIVQDLGLASIIHNRYPGLRLHASTQINAQTVEDVKVLKEIGFNRVILGREVSLETIKKIRESVDIELEVFIHGALCISYSGGCYISSFETSRSGNRGKCSQLCRLPYTFNGRKKFYLSPKDLCTISSVKEIAKYVDSLKIEGRMKSKEYVYNVVSSYVDALNNDLTSAEIDERIYKMKISFNRGYTKGFINSTTNNELTNVNKSNHQGVLIGKVVNAYKQEVSIELIHDLIINDSIRFVSDDLELDAVTVSNMYTSHTLTKHAYNKQIVNLKTHKEIKIGASVYLTKRESSIDVKKRKVKASGEIASINENLVIKLTSNNKTVERIVKAESSDKDFTARYIEQLKKTNDTPFIISDIKGSVPNKFVPLSVINEARRDLLNELSSLLIKRDKRVINTKPLILKKNNEKLDIKDIGIIDSSYRTLYDQSLNNLTIFDRNFNMDNFVIPRVSSTKYNNKVAIFTNLGNLNKISSPYTNVANSYTVRLLESLGVSIVTLSVEIGRDQIIELIEAYKNRYEEEPNLGLLVFGHIELMLMKHCFINKEKGYKTKGCKECRKDILLNEKFPVYGDLECHLTLLSKDVINLTKFIDELEGIGIKHFIYDFTKVTEDELKTIDNPKGYYGHYINNI